MTLDEAFIELSNSPGYKEIAKMKDSKGGKYRIWLTRFKAGNLKTGAIVEILISNGYEVIVNRVKKSK